jgi:DUF2934 family protein
MAQAPKKPTAEKPNPTPINRGRELAKPPVSAAPQSLPRTETTLSVEDEIRSRAYELYEQDGRQEGREQEHWLRAEAEVTTRRQTTRKQSA